MSFKVAPEASNILYIYDLPKSHFTSIRLAEIIKEITGYDLVGHSMPQVTRDINKPFYTARVKIESTDKFAEIAKKLRYFTFSGYPCRTLPYLQELLGSNVLKLMDNNVFVRKIPKHIMSRELENVFSIYGEIISCKVSIQEDYTSRGYGFVCFKDPESAHKALLDRQEAEEMVTFKFAPRSRVDLRKVFNNIYVKNFPADWTEADLRRTFEEFGQITSIHHQ